MPRGTSRVRSAKVSHYGAGLYLAYEFEIWEDCQHKFSKFKFDLQAKSWGGLPAMYVAALTTPQVMTSEHPSIVATSSPHKSLTASPDMSSSTQTGRKKRQQLLMFASFIRQQIEVGVNDLMHEVSKQLAEIVKSIVQNEMQLIQQQQREMSQVQGHLTEAMPRNGPKAMSEATTYTRGASRALTWPSAVNQKTS